MEGAGQGKARGWGPALDAVDGGRRVAKGGVGGVRASRACNPYNRGARTWYWWWCRLCESYLGDRYTAGVEGVVGYNGGKNKARGCGKQQGKKPGETRPCLERRRTDWREVGCVGRGSSICPQRYIQ